MNKILAILIMVAGYHTYGQEMISGRVLESSGVPIENAHVTVGKIQMGTYTNSKGEFELRGLTEGSYTLNFSHVSFGETSRLIKVPGDGNLEIVMYPVSLLKDKVVVEATRADATTPTTFTDVSAEQLEKSNFGQDIPVILEFTPSVVSTSDAGAGIGYTGIRIRGTDQTRINVTINGIPLNDSEQHGVFWVNTPDLVSSTSSIQVQRGVGTSTNGAAAFGATINLLTETFEQDPYAEYRVSAGSFNTLRNTLQFGTGLIKNRWSVDGRLSTITSDGYIDRASSDLRSYYLSGLYNGNRTVVRFLTFAGNERTYQSWWGTPQARLENDVEGMNLVADLNGYTQEQRDNLLNSGRTFNYYQYEDQVDNYSQDHYQLHVNSALNDQTNLNFALHYTYGRGFFEEYKIDDDFADYDIDPVVTNNGTISSSDLVRRRWLDNHFAGTTFSIVRDSGKLNWVFGGALNKYEGDHFGEVIWSQYAPNIPKDYRYYDNSSIKTDGNLYTKLKYSVNDRLLAYMDLQLRNIAYTAEGPDNDRIGGNPVIIDIDENYTFFNPKFGLNYSPESGGRFYLSYAVAHREPVRSDFIDNQRGTTPSPEVLRNLELGFEKALGRSFVQVNAYHMDYKDQLVLTGALNDVGASIRTNVDRSYRTGIELLADIPLNDYFRLGGNATLSSNRIESYDEILYDYGVNYDEFNVVTTTFENTDIAFSPSMIGSAQLTYSLGDNFETSLITKYVGRQFLDNTSNSDRSISPYLVGYLRANYTVKLKGLENLSFGLLINNLFNELYEANGYTFGYRGGGMEVRENYFYPQAERNFMLSMNIKF